MQWWILEHFEIVAQAADLEALSKTHGLSKAAVSNLQHLHSILWRSFAAFRYAKKHLSRLSWKAIESMAQPEQCRFVIEFLPAFLVSALLLLQHQICMVVFADKGSETGSLAKERAISPLHRQASPARPCTLLLLVKKDCSSAADVERPIPAVWNVSRNISISRMLCACSYPDGGRDTEGVGVFYTAVSEKGRHVTDVEAWVELPTDLACAKPWCEENATYEEPYDFVSRRKEVVTVSEAMEACVCAGFVVALLEDVRHKFQNVLLPFHLPSETVVDASRPRARCCLPSKGAQEIRIVSGELALRGPEAFRQHWRAWLLPDVSSAGRLSMSSHLKSRSDNYSVKTMGVKRCVPANMCSLA